MFYCPTTARLFVAIAFFVQFDQFAIAQTSGADTTDYINHWFIEPSARSGYVFPTNSFLRGSNLEGESIGSYNSISIKAGVQTLDDRPWVLHFAHPTIGFGVNVVQFNESDELGTPIALFGFLNGPFKRWRRVSLDYEIALGFAFNWKPFDPVNNPDNVSIGAKESAYVDLGVQASFAVTDRLYANAGFNVTHYSNGALRKPNQGVNMIAPEIGLRYDLYKDGPVSPSTGHRSVFHPSTDLDIAVFGGSQNVIYDSLNVELIEKYEGVNYLAVGIQATVSRHFAFKSKLGVGFSADYNGAHDAQVSVANGDVETVRSPFHEKLQLSIYPSYEFVINKTSILVQPSFYVARTNASGQTPVFYQRLGIRQTIRPWLFVGMNLRAYQLHVSEFLEWNIGYRFHR